MFVTYSTIKFERIRQLPIHLFSLFVAADQMWLAGGAVRSMLTGETPQDYDLFFGNAESKEQVQQFLEDVNFTKTFHCPQNELITYEKDNIKIQLVLIRYYTSAEDLLYRFDFTATAAAFDGSQITADCRWVHDVRNKYLNLARLTYPKSTIKRLIKYANYGYHVNFCIEQLTQELTSGEWDDYNLDYDRMYVD